MSDRFFITVNGTMDQLDRIAAKLGGAIRLELCACGHSPHHDQAQAALDAAARLLKSHGQ